MNSRLLRGSMLAGALALALASHPAHAQDRQPVGAAATPEPAVVANYKAEMGARAADFWTTKLNTYKVRIDDMLSPNDLAELNKLRVRWGLMVDGMLQAKSSGKTGSVGIGSGLDGTGADQDIEINTTGEEMMAGAVEGMAIYTSVRELATRNASNLRLLRKPVATDVKSFFDDMVEHGKHYRAQHAAEIEAAGVASQFDMFGKDVPRDEDLNFEKAGDEGIYSLAIEPLLLLYNGMDLGRFLQGPTAGTASPVAGLALPESAVLKQNFPNPASSSTTIPYQLPEGSTKATLRVFDQTGATVSTRELPATGAGDHDFTLDVSSMPTGSYLYQLTVSTPRGQQVYARTMRVVR